MKKLALLGMPLLISLALVACSANQTSSTEVIDVAVETQLTYADYVADLVLISAEELVEKMAADQDFLLYLGRESCPYCNVFVPKLAEALEQTPRTVYYYDTEDREDEFLLAFSDRYAIQTVPHMAYFEGQERVDYLEAGSQSSLEDIQALLELLKDY